MSASSAALAFTGVVSVTDSPDSGTGAILLIDDEARQDVRITCDVTLDTDCENAGIVFGGGGDSRGGGDEMGITSQQWVRDTLGGPSGAGFVVGRARA